MKNAVALAVAALVLHGIAAPMAHAQKGVGDPTGVARQPIKPEVVSISGRLVEIKTGPCEATTGRSPIGTHLILESAEKEQLNIHLGPASAVAETVARLSLGQEIAAKAFRTDKLKDKHYVAKSLTFDKATVDLRDDTLRPLWAQGNGAGRAPVTGQGGGQGRGPGWGRGGYRWRGGANGFRGQ